MDVLMRDWQQDRQARPDGISIRLRRNDRKVAKPTVPTRRGGDSE